MPHGSNKPRRTAPVLRALVEIGFIVFLFYSNLLMGEFCRSAGQAKTLEAALVDIFTVTNFSIGLAAALIGHLIFEFLRKKFWLYPPHSNRAAAHFGAGLSRIRVCCGQ